MPDATLFVLFAALVLDWFVGEPKVLWSRLPHPVVLFGKLVEIADRKLNKPSDSDSRQWKAGALAISALILTALIVALAIQFALGLLWIVGMIVEILIVFVFIAQKSLVDHVGAVSRALREEGVDGARKAVALIVGRDPEYLERNGICRAAIESLAENFSDGVVAPAFWYAVFGLPGLFVYKMINTADSMIGHRSDKYLYFGRAAAQIDDLANWLPARMSAFLIAGASTVSNGVSSGKQSLGIAFRDAGLHRSPNAGWPEAAMAGAANIALGGPRIYAGETVEQSYLNSSGKHDLEAGDIERTLALFAGSCILGWAVVGLLSLA